MFFLGVSAVNSDECLMTRMQEMSLDYHFSVEQEVGSSTYAFFGFNGKSLGNFFYIKNHCYPSMLYCSGRINVLLILFNEILLQGRQVCGELLHLMRLEDGKIGPRWKIWTWLSELVSKAGNFCTLEVSRYSIINEQC